MITLVGVLGMLLGSGIILGSILNRVKKGTKTSIFFDVTMLLLVSNGLLVVVGEM